MNHVDWLWTHLEVEKPRKSSPLADLMYEMGTGIWRKNLENAMLLIVT